MQREKRALYLINGVYWITMGMYFPFISTFFLKRGMDTLQIGILTSISPVAAIAVQPLWARLADRTGKRKQVLMGLAAAAAVMILFYLKAYTFAAIFAVAVAFACVNSAVQPMSDALSINKAQEIGAEFSRIRMTGTITYRWQQSSDGSSWSNTSLSGYSSSTLSFSATQSRLSYKYRLIDQKYRLAVLNEVLCLVEYQATGSSNSMLKQYVRNPRGFASWRKIRMQFPESRKRIFMDCIHYVSSSILSRNPAFIAESPRKIETIAAIPFGLVLTGYVLWKTRK